MLQKEVAERLTAQPPAMNRLAALIQYFATPTIVRIVPPAAFSPPPKVTSAVLLLSDIRRPRRRDHAVTALIALGFSHPRKLLLTNLSAKFSRERVERVLERLSLPRTVRPAVLTPQAWERLSTYLRE
jgi:16S rRNA (adenine1518-N6/adenine1519-N6)-dimethyltransferase